MRPTRVEDLEIEALVRARVREPVRFDALARVTRKRCQGSVAMRVVLDELASLRVSTREDILSSARAYLRREEPFYFIGVVLTELL